MKKIKTREFGRDEKSLLLYFETLEVDHGGFINDPRKLNDVDHKIAEQWNESGFCEFKRATRHKQGDPILTYRIKLSDEAWKLAHQERRARAERTRESFS